MPPQKQPVTFLKAVGEALEQDARGDLSREQVKYTNYNSLQTLLQNTSFLNDHSDVFRETMLNAVKTHFPKLTETEKETLGWKHKTEAQITLSNSRWIEIH